jgi:hypothetical protein
MIMAKTTANFRYSAMFDPILTEFYRKKPETDFLVHVSSEIQDLLNAGDYVKVNMLVGLCNCHRMETQMIVLVAKCTEPHKQHIMYRSCFIQKAKKVLQDRGNLEALNLMKD